MKAIHLIPNGVYQGIGIGVVIVLLILGLIYLVGWIVQFWYWLKRETQMQHYFCYYILRRRWPTERLREIWAYPYGISKTAHRQLLKYRRRNIRDAEEDKLQVDIWWRD